MEILTRKDLAKQFKCSIRTIDYLVSTGQIPYFRMGKRGVRFEKSRLADWVKTRENVEYRLDGKASN